MESFWRDRNPADIWQTMMQTLGKFKKFFPDVIIKINNETFLQIPTVFIKYDLIFQRNPFSN